MTYVQNFKTDTLLIPLSEVKTFLKVDFSADDALITSLIQSVTTWAEKFMNRDILATEYTNFRETFESDLTLRRGGFLEFTKIEVLVDGVKTLVPAADYTIKIGGVYGEICEIEVPTHDEDCNAIQITFFSGFGFDPTDVPADLLTAIKNHVSFLYFNRSDCGSNQMPGISEMVYNNYKIVDAGPNEGDGRLICI